MAKASKLSERQKLFAEELLVDENQTQAAIRAGYSVKAAKEMGYKLMTYPKVVAYVEKLRAKRAKRVGVTQYRVLEEMARIGFSDPRKLIGEDGKILNPKDWPDEAAAAVGSFDITTSKDGKVEVSRIKLLDKRVTLDNLARHLGLYDKDKLHLEGNVEVLIKKFTFDEE